MVTARDRVLPWLVTPRCARELSELACVPVKTAQSVLWRSARLGLVACVTPDVRQSRLYRLSPLGSAWIAEAQGEMPACTEWDEFTLRLRAWVQSGKYRRAVLSTLDGPMTPQGLRKNIRHVLPSLRAGINHVQRTLQSLRDVRLVRTIVSRRTLWVRTPLGDRVHAMSATGDTRSTEWPALPAIPGGRHSR